MLLKCNNSTFMLVIINNVSNVIALVRYMM